MGWQVCRWLILAFGAGAEAACIYVAARMFRQAALTRRLRTTRIADISRPGLYEVTGEVVNPHPVVCLGHKCVWYEYERSRLAGKGGFLREWAEKDFVPFMVHDGSGFIGVDPEGATVDARPLLAKQGWDPDGATLLRPGPLIRERLRGIEVGSRVYVAGPVVRKGAVLSFEADGTAPLIISYRSEVAFRLTRILWGAASVAAGMGVPFGVWYALRYIGRGGLRRSSRAFSRRAGGG